MRAKGEIGNDDERCAVHGGDVTPSFSVYVCVQNPFYMLQGHSMIMMTILPASPHSLFKCRVIQIDYKLSIIQCKIYKDI